MKGWFYCKGVDNQILQEFILPIRAGMTIEKAMEQFPDIPYQATNKAIYYDMFMRYPDNLAERIKTICPNCGNKKIVPVLFYSKENIKLVEEYKGILAPGAYDNPSVPYGNYACLECGY